MPFWLIVRDFVIAFGLLFALLWVIGCAYIEKNMHIYVHNSDNAEVSPEYTTRSATDVDAKDLIKVPLVP